MNTADKIAALKLIEIGTLIDFRVIETDKELSPDGHNLHLRVELIFTDPDDGDDEVAENIAEWGTFGFIFVLAALSFAGARPRGISENDYVEDDELTVADLFDCLRFVRGELHFQSDYIRGRSMKTNITVRQNGTVSFTTWGRGEAALRWLDRLKGKKHIQVVGG